MDVIDNVSSGVERGFFCIFAEVSGTGTGTLQDVVRHAGIDMIAGFLRISVVTSLVLIGVGTGCGKAPVPDFRSYANVVNPDRPGQNPPVQDESDLKKILVVGNSMVYYGGCVMNGNQKNGDAGLLFQLIKAGGGDAVVYDCTYGGHALHDFTARGCTSASLHGDSGIKASGHCPGLGTDLLIQDLASVDCVFISEAGNNNADFYTDATAVFNRVKMANPDVKCFYINHIYSVYKNHSKVLSQLKNLHDKDGVTIINCGQLAYDIYTGKVKVPGGSMTYSDRYTFCNHTSSDTYHPNPLMGYIMAQMCYCALTGKDADFAGYSDMVKNSTYGAGGSVSYDKYYSKYYTTPAEHPFMDVIDNAAEIKGIQMLIPSYIDRF